jgi:hypothetical protein
MIRVIINNIHSHKIGRELNGSKIYLLTPALSPWRRGG